LYSGLPSLLASWRYIHTESKWFSGKTRSKPVSSRRTNSSKMGNLRRIILSTTARSSENYVKLAGVEISKFVRR
jgi:hypothetical protein